MYASKLKIMVQIKNNKLFELKIFKIFQYIV